MISPVTGLCYAELVTRPENVKYLMSKRSLTLQMTDDEDTRIDGDPTKSPSANGKHLSTIMYNIFGEFPAVVTGCLDILVNITVVSATR